MGALTLKVANVDAMSSYYETLGLQVISEIGNQRVLGRLDTATLVLEHSPGLKHAGPREAGLFHTAFLFDSPSQLAAAVGSVARRYPGSFTGSADHLVSEAFYFDDPEGNGVELYTDRDRSLWQWAGGQVQMDTLALDPNDYLSRHLTYTAPAASTIGHVHLCVGDVALAKVFYVDTLGFDMTFNWGGSALFVSAGGYHHHMAMNIWRSRGASRRNQTLGLGNVTIEVTEKDDLLAASDRLRHAGIAFAEDEQFIRVYDPWGNQVTLQWQSERVSRSPSDEGNV